MIVTSYYGNWRALIKDGYDIVCISRAVPAVGIKEVCREFAPSARNYRLFKSGFFDIPAFTEAYTKQLSEVDVKSVLNRFEGRNVALCCYERSTDFCHRKVLAAYIKERFNIDIKEYGVN